VLCLLFDALSESWCIRGDGIRIAYVARGIVLDIFSWSYNFDLIENLSSHLSLSSLQCLILPSYKGNTVKRTQFIRPIPCNDGVTKEKLNKQSLLQRTRCTIVELSVLTARCSVPSADSRIGTCDIVHRVYRVWIVNPQ
jgi:hypothetical protein